MSEEQKLLLVLGRKMLNLYFSGLSPLQLSREFNKAISNFLDMADDFNIKKEA